MRAPLKIILLMAALSCAWPCAGAAPVGFTSAHETVAIQPDGSARVRSELSWKERDSGSLLLPFNYTAAENLRVTQGEKGAVVAARLEQVEGMTYLRVAAARRAATVAADFIVPRYLDWNKAGPGEYGYYRWKSMYRNNMRRPIDSVTLEIVLPPGFIAAGFGRSVPSPAAEEALPPYWVKNVDGASHLFMKAGNLALGRACSLEYSFARRGRSPWLPLAAALAALLWLFFCRDLIFMK